MIDYVALDIAVKAISQHNAIQKVKEFTRLLEFLMDHKLNVVVEIGTHKGGTLYAWSKIAENNAMIITIDLEKRFPIFHKRCNQEVLFIKGDSHNNKIKESIQTILFDKEIDLLFIDGDHSYEGAKEDWEMYSSLVKKGGFVVFHDILEHPNFPNVNVKRLWDEIKSEYKYYEFNENEDDSWGGIGIIQK